jgi:hypothetical protein
MEGIASLRRHKEEPAGPQCLKHYGTSTLCRSHGRQLRCEENDMSRPWPNNSPEGFSLFLCHDPGGSAKYLGVPQNSCSECLENR